METNFDRWVYLLKQLSSLENRPPELQGRIFDMLFRATDVSKLTLEEMESYRKSILEYEDVRSAVDLAKEEGIEIGIKKNKIEIAQNCLKKGLSVEMIAELTGLSVEQINKIS